MKTIELKVYPFAELSEQAKQKAISDYRENQDFDYIYYDAEQTMKKFCEEFNVTTGRHSWLDFGSYNTNYEDEILNFSNERLKTYKKNNFGKVLFAPKWMGSLKSNKIFRHLRIKSKPLKNGNVYNPYYSAIFKESKTYNLTGVCYDESILKPIYDFLDGSDYQNYDLNNLFKACFEELRKDIENEIDFRNSDICISEELELNDYDFLESGEQY